MIIEVDVRGKIARLKDSEQFVVCDNTDYIIRFDFDEEWQNSDIKTARFRWNGKTADVLFAGNECEMPKIDDAWGLEIGVFSGNLKTTTPAYLSCKKSIRSGTGAPVPPSDDIYDQIMEALESKLTVPPFPEFDGRKYALCIVPNALGTGWGIKWNEVTAEDPSTSNIVGIGKVGFMIIA